MYCPKCSQQQVSDEVRFCSRCGFALTPVAELLSAENPLAVRQGEKPAKRARLQSPGTRIGAKLIFFSLISMPVTIAFSGLFDTPGPLVITALLFLAGIAQLIYARIFGESLLPERLMSKFMNTGVSTEQKELPAPPQQPARLFDSKPANTAELAHPPSVTERTTTLLDKK
jgi:hypothetical protein